MRKNFKKKLFSIIIAGGVVLSGSTAMARQIGTLTQFKLPAW